MTTQSYTLTKSLWRECLVGVTDSLNRLARRRSFSCTKVSCCRNRVDSDVTGTIGMASVANRTWDANLRKVQNTEQDSVDNTTTNNTIIECSLKFSENFHNPSNLFKLKFQKIVPLNLQLSLDSFLKLFETDHENFHIQNFQLLSITEHQCGVSALASWGPQV